MYQNSSILTVLGIHADREEIFCLYLKTSQELRKLPFTSNKLSGKSSLNVRSVCPVCPVCPSCPVFPVCPDDHDDQDEHDYNDNHNHENHDDQFCTFTFWQQRAL